MDVNKESFSYWLCQTNTRCSEDFATRALLKEHPEFKHVLYLTHGAGGRGKFF